MAIIRGWTSGEGPIEARKFLALRPPRRAAVRKLMEDICGTELTARKRATDLARLISAREPGIFSEWTDMLIYVLAELAPGSEGPLAEWQSCNYVALAAARNTATRAQRVRLARVLRPMLEHSRIASRATALEAFCRVAAAEPDLRDEALAAIEEARADGSPAMRARAKAMMGLLRLRRQAKGQSSGSKSTQMANSKVIQLLRGN